MSRNEPLKLSLILSGAISLGAYEAGVVAQLAYALGKWNEGRKKPIAIVDVIAGASAGSITGAMLGCHIMRGTDPAEFVRMMHAQWCNTTFEQMLDPNKVDAHAILSAKDIDSDGKGLFDDKHPMLDLQGDPIKPGKAYFDDLVKAKPDIARIQQDELIFTSTLTSLEPIPFRFKIDGSEANVAGDEFMIGLTRQDYMTFSLARGDAASPVMELPVGKKRDAGGRPVDWDRLFWVSVTSGAFPGAWQPMTISRLNSDYLEPWKDEPGYTHLHYVDGGVLNNLPFGRASDALEHLRLGTQPDEQRLYILIEPEPDKAKDSANRFAEEPPRRDDQTPLLTVLNKVLAALREQSFYMDVLEAQKVNRRLQARNAFFPQLVADAVNGLTTEQVDERLEQVKSTLQDYLSKRASRRTWEDVLAEYQEEYQQEDKMEEKKRILQSALPPNAADTRHELFLLQLALLDYTANLQDKCQITFLRIHPEMPEDLAGEILGHFGGLLDASFLRHDFARGLDDTYVRLKKLGEARGWEKPARVLDDIPQYGIEPDVAKMAKLPFSQLPVKMRERFTDLLIDRMLTFLGNEANFKSLKRGPIRAALRAYLDHIVFPER